MRVTPPPIIGLLRETDDNDIFYDQLHIASLWSWKNKIN